MVEEQEGLVNSDLVCEGREDEDRTTEEIALPSAQPVKLRILLTGSGGLLGSDLMPVLKNLGHEIRSPRKSEFDLTVRDNLDRIRKEDFGDFDWIVNCAAYTAVDQAESDRMAAMQVNAVLPGLLGLVANDIGARVLHISTDFVFDGSASNPYTEESVTHPLNVYGTSKLLGEQNLLKENSESVILRTSWLYGPNGKSFPRTMIEADRAGKGLRVVTDQIGNPTYTVELSNQIGKIISTPLPGGIYHSAGPDAMSWWELAVLSIATDRLLRNIPIGALKDQIAKVTSAEYPTPARRPRYSALDCTKLQSFGFEPMKKTSEALIDFARRLQ